MPTCKTQFKYVCDSKSKLDALELSIESFKKSFVQNYINYQKNVNKQITANRPETPTEVSNPNYNQLLSIFTQLETLKNEVTSRISENSILMQKIDASIAKNKKVTSAVSSQMTSLTNKADGSRQAYKDSLGLYRRDVFKNFAFLFASGGIIYVTRQVFMESAT
jgi:hypothetical protein